MFAEGSIKMYDFLQTKLCWDGDMSFMMGLHSIEQPSGLELRKHGITR
jgi:hypothetical protein